MYLIDTLVKHDSISCSRFSLIVFFLFVCAHKQSTPHSPKLDRRTQQIICSHSDPYATHFFLRSFHFIWPNASDYLVYMKRMKYWNSIFFCFVRFVYTKLDVMFILFRNEYRNDVGLCTVHMQKKKRPMEWKNGRIWCDDNSTHRTKKMYAKQDVLVYQHNATEIFWKQKKNCEKKDAPWRFAGNCFYFLLRRNWCSAVFVNDTQNNCPGRRCQRAEEVPFDGGSHIKFSKSWRAGYQSFSLAVTQKCNIPSDGSYLALQPTLASNKKRVVLLKIDTKYQNKKDSSFGATTRGEERDIPKMLNKWCSNLY